MSMIIGVDNGYGNTKTARRCFKTALVKYDSEPVLKKIQEARLQSDYKQARAILDRIPPEIIRAYTQRSSMKKEVEQYNTLE